MFHHFHGEGHPTGQGSLAQDDFEAILDWIAQRSVILPARDYLERLVAGRLKAEEVCLTFDDGLLCQIDIAEPVLRRRGLEAFFFVYSSPFKGTPDFLEVFRYFRSTCFSTIDHFYEKFFARSLASYPDRYRTLLAEFDPDRYLNAFPFYSGNDKWFRYLRDVGFGKKVYEELMLALMEERSFRAEEVLARLWMNDHHLRALQARGHIIGLHSFSHPTVMHVLSRGQQEEEYGMNARHLLEVLGDEPVAMSHPCGNYSQETLALLRNKGVLIGFRSNMGVRSIRSNLEVPREDHANIMAEIKRCE